MVFCRGDTDNFDILEIVDNLRYLDVRYLDLFGFLTRFKIFQCVHIAENGCGLCLIHGGVLSSRFLSLTHQGLHRVE